MKSAIVKRSVIIRGHKTSISLEDVFWDHLWNMARAQQCTLSKLVAEIDEGAPRRQFILRNPRIHT